MTTQISSKDVGKLIGRAGVSIKELRQKSGCKIEVGDQSGNFETEVMLSGPSQEIVEKAKIMIDEFVTIFFYLNNYLLNTNHFRGPLENFRHL